MEGLNGAILGNPGRARLASDDSAEPSVAKNIKRFSDLYKEFLDSEIREEIEKEYKQTEKINRLRGTENHPSGNDPAQ